MSRVALTSKINTLAADNLRDIFENTDEPKASKENLLKMLNKHPDWVLLVVRSGWRTLRTEHRDILINQGVVAALLVSVLMGLAVAPLQPNNIEDSWAEHREVFCRVYQCLCMSAFFFAIIAVHMSIWSVMVLGMYGSNDFYDYTTTLNKLGGDGKLVYVPSLAAMFLSVAAVAFAAVVILEETEASILFYTFFGGMLVVAIFCGFTTIAIFKPQMQKGRQQTESLLKQIESAYEKATSENIENTSE